jgi:hypothetical protein
VLGPRYQPPPLPSCYQIAEGNVVIIHGRTRKGDPRSVSSASELQ